MELKDENISKIVWRDRLLKWGLLFAFWSALGILYGTQLYIDSQYEQRDPSFWKLLCWQLFGYWYGWFAFTPCILWLGKRFPFEKALWKRSGLIHTAVFITFLMALSSWYVFLGIELDPHHLQQNFNGFWSYVMFRVTHRFYLELIIYGMILGIGYAFDYHRRFREREFRASQLESQLALSQLQVLKMQLHPHFLFNTLNGITGLVRDKKNKVAVNMLVGLSDLLRYTLQNAHKQEVPLREELEFLELYLDLQQMRFSDRLEVKMDIDPDSLEIIVPNLILQPLVENALRHGIAQRISAGLIKITTRCENGMLQVKVYDNGLGLQENWQLENNAGIGLANVRERLHQIYGEGEYRLDICNQKNGGVEATIRIPRRVVREEI